MENEVMNILMKRRSCRSFLQKDIEPEKKEMIQKATLRAPTAGNQLFYSIIDIKDRNIKEKLAVLCDNQPMIAKAPMVWLFVADVQKWENFYRLNGSVEKGKQRGIQERKVGAGELFLALDDALIAAQNAVIAAESFGIGSCYIGDILENHEQIVSMFSLPKYAAVATLLVFGYPKSTQELAHPSIRPSVDAVFMENSYQDYTLEKLKYAYGEQEKAMRRRKGLPEDSDETISDDYYFRKHMSDFMEEMNRSGKLLYQRWME
ncbi:MAG: nitroreductase family protein [Sphaerochaetaceae bacterium]|nr:nitroreductase family protein [Sphaerochaetaceae bacterium]